MRSELDAKNSTWRVLGAQEARLKHSAAQAQCGAARRPARGGRELLCSMTLPGCPDRQTDVDPPWTAAL